MIITIDGAAGTGKSTVARLVAERLKIPYFDTGAMYRAFTLFLLNNEISLDDKNGIQSALSEFSFDIRIQDAHPVYYVNERDVTSEIRSQKVNAAVSEVSAIASVREAMWKLQRAYGHKQGAVFEGRDMGTAVFLDAEVKIFLDADPRVRAKRRLEEMRKKQPNDAPQFTEKSMEKELQRRDAHDSSRSIAPLKCPKKALRIDTSSLSIEEVVDQIIEQCKKQAVKLAPSWLKSKKMKFLYRLTLFLAWCFAKCFYKYRVYGLEHYVKKRAIIAPNHTSYMDPPIVAVSWPEEVHFLARESLFHFKPFGAYIRALNSHPVHGDVADVAIFKTMIHLLKEGKQIVLFPEGGRTDGELGEIKPGIGMLVMRSKAAIVPTYIKGAADAWGRHRKFPKIGKEITCVFGSAISWESFAHLEKRKAQEEIAKALTNSMLNLKKWLESGAKGTPP